MRYVTAGAEEASTSGPARWRYDVFLSFRGDDTRNNFIDHLYTALAKAGFYTFRDNDGIGRGENIGLEIEKAIQESEISVVVLSKDYASSRWCLNELVHIMQCRRTNQRHVIPIFYYIDPSQVRKQTGDYATAFVRHQRQYKEEMVKVEMWRTALREIADLGGMVLQHRNEATFIEDVVKEIRKKLDKQVLHVSNYVVGRKNLIHEINGWLQNGINHVGVATIYGIGGVGKTTVAKIVFNSNCNKFEGSSFLANIRDISGEVNGLVRLQEQIVSDLLREKNVKIWNIHEGVMKIKHALLCKRVLLVLDDVVDLDQLEALVGKQEWFYPGSRIIITTRNEYISRAWVICKRILVKGLFDDESLQLLSWHAFEQDHPIDGYVELSQRLVQHCGGLPLALKVIGSSLRGKPHYVWESQLKKLEAIMDNKIHKILITSYNSLPDDHDKNLFLDICCYFVGMDKDYTATILNGSGFYAATGIQNLTDRCLISINRNNEIEMHQLIRGMGREIVRQESPENPGKRSRIWHDEDALNVLRGETGTETVRGFSFGTIKDALQRELENAGNAPLSNGEKPYVSKRRHLNLFAESREGELFTKGFKAMHSLQLLRLDHVKLTGSFRDFPNGLVWLCWHAYPWISIPNDFYLGNLVALEMCHSRLTNNWKNAKVLGQLKILDLSYCYNLTEASDFKGLPRLQKLMLNYCINLIEIDDSIAYLQNLLSLQLRGCRSLRKLSSKICVLGSLEELDLSDCSEIEVLPLDLRGMYSLRILRLYKIALGRSRWSGRNSSPGWPRARIKIFPSRLPQSKIPRLTGFPPGFSSSSLVELTLARCRLSNEISTLDFSRMSSLEKLDMGYNPFRNLPKGIIGLQNLRELITNGCRRLQSIPELPKSLKCLRAYACESLESIVVPQGPSTDFNYEILGCGRSPNSEVWGWGVNEDGTLSIDKKLSLELKPVESRGGETHMDAPGGPPEIVLERKTSGGSSWIYLKVPPGRSRSGGVYSLSTCGRLRRVNVTFENSRFLFLYTLFEQNPACKFCRGCIPEGFGNE